MNALGRSPCWICVVSGFVIANMVASLAASATFDFAASLEGWQPQWHKESSTGTDGMVSLDASLGFDDSASLLFDMGDGGGDDGTLWIERALPAPGTEPISVRIDFQLFSDAQSDFNQFQVKAFVGGDDPDVQADFTTIGSTNRVPGWADYHFESLASPVNGQVWTAVGIRVAWETPREYWIDKVSVNIVPEPTSIVLLGSAAVAYALICGRRLPASQ